MLCSKGVVPGLGLGLFAFSFCCWVGMDASFLVYCPGGVLGVSFWVGLKILVLFL